MQKEFFNAAQLPFPTSTSQCDPELAENLVRIVENCSLIGLTLAGNSFYKKIASDTPIRPITLELCCVILRHILVCLDNDQAPLCPTSIESAVRRTQHKLATVLKGAIQTEKLFLEMFEDEYYQLQVYNCYYYITMIVSEKWIEIVESFGRSKSLFAAKQHTIIVRI